MLEEIEGFHFPQAIQYLYIYIYIRGCQKNKIFEFKNGSLIFRRARCGLMVVKKILSQIFYI